MKLLGLVNTKGLSRYFPLDVAYCSCDPCKDFSCRFELRLRL